MIKAYKYMQLLRGANGNQFDINHKTWINGTICKVDEIYANDCNENCLQSGKYFELDVELTEKLFSTKPKAETTLKPTPIIPAVNQNSLVDNDEGIVEVEDKTEDQTKYNKRKEKMITAGFVFENETFTKGEISIKANELLNLHSVKFGKLLKS